MASDDQRWKTLRQLDEWLDTPMVLLSELSVVIVLVELTTGGNALMATIGAVVWLTFIAEFALRLALAPKKLPFQAQLARSNRTAGAGATPVRDLPLASRGLGAARLPAGAGRRHCQRQQPVLAGYRRRPDPDGAAVALLFRHLRLHHCNLRQLVRRPRCREEGWSGACSSELKQLASELRALRAENEKRHLEPAAVHNRSGAQ
jgi:hypothetical protein